MTKLNRITLKKKFLEFFESKDHKIISPASLIPENDPTVLFTTAGMHPLVPYLLGQPHPLGRKLADNQICIRTTDIDEIGDSSHFTFFEMLGNWSLGDYFKKEAITYAYEFLTSKEWLNLSKERLAVTCFSGSKEVPKDEESEKYWLEVGIQKDRLAFLKDNWWGPAGTSGPCGPDTEIYYWKPNSKPAPKTFDPEDDDWLEIWNLVLMEYNKDKNGKFTSLKQKNIDTGMGVERVATIINGEDDVYQEEKIAKLLEFIESLSVKKISKETMKAYKIIADHLRATTFILADSRAVVPSNTDQGYILRRFIRRAIRFGKMIGIEDGFCSKVAEKIINLYSDEYQYLLDKRKFIEDELGKEENKFRMTLENGLKEFNKLVEKGKELSGKDSFLLYQSYGFPIEMIVEFAKEKNISVDTISFEKEFQIHQDLSRVGSEKKFKGGLAEHTEITEKYHTATHILNQALRNIISKDIKQKGSNITSERLRFDFNFDRKLTDDEINNVEDEVNRVISLNLPVTKESMPLEQALETGAQSEFGTKYPEVVWVYSIGDYSKEICAGPHAENTKYLGIFKIVKEEAVASGIRRIKATLS